MTALEGGGRQGLGSGHLSHIHLRLPVRPALVHNQAEHPSSRVKGKHQVPKQSELEDTNSQRCIKDFKMHQRA